MSPPNTDNWVSPDDFFVPREAVKTESSASSSVNSEENTESTKCQAWIQKYTECEKSLESTGFLRNSQKAEVSNEASECPCEAEGVEGYLKRFIYLLLEASNLNTRDIDSMNKGEITFFISDEQLMTLKKFIKEGKTKSIPLRKLDEIFAAVFVRSYLSLPSLENLLDNLPSVHVGSFFFLGLLPAIWFLSALLITRNIRKSFLWLIPVIFVTSFLTTAYRMFEEAQIKQYEKIKMYPDIPKNCRSTGLSSVFSFGKSECAKALEAHHIDTRLHVTPFKVLTEMFGETISATMDHVGRGSVVFIEKFAEMGYFYRLLFLPVGCVILGLIGVLISLVLTGGTVRLPYFMGSVNFYNSKKDDMGTSHTSCQSRNNVSPPSSNITFNFNNQLPPPTVNDILHSFRESMALGRTTNSDQLDPQCDTRQLGAGDGLHAMLEDNPDTGYGSNSSHSRLSVNVGHKKFHKQFSQLERYKAKSNSKFKKVRKLSL